MSLAGLDIAFLGATPFTGPNYTAERGRFVVKQGGREITTLEPEKHEFQPGR
jgi:cytochrome c-type biogenesis protein CcmF